MSRWLDIASAEELVPGNRRLIEIEGMGVIVFNLRGEFFAIKNVCPHDGGELDKGNLEGEVIICPRHGARFSVRTGAVLGPPAYEDLPTFPVRIANGRLQVEIE